MHSLEFRNINVWTKSHDNLDSSWLLIDTLVAGLWLLLKSHDTLTDRELKRICNLCKLIDQSHNE